MEFDPHTRERPKNFVWCGEDCIAVSWPNRGILLVSPYCDYLRFDYDVSHEPLFLLQEIDSLRVFSRFHHDIIRAVFLFAHSHLKVPPPIYNVYSMGSQTPGAILRSAFARFAQKAGERDMEEGVGDLRDDLLDSAVKECIDAAEEELSSLLQEELLRSASYGQNYLQNMTHSFQKVDFRKTTGFLRIINTLRTPEIGLYLTANQFRFLKERSVISRLLSRRLYYLSVQVE